MMHLQAGYILDEVFELYYKQKGYEDFEKAIAEFSKLCYFELAGLEEFELNENTERLDKTLLIAYNIINRGTPTRASIFVTEKILSQYGYQIKKNNERGDIVFHRSNTDLINISNDVATIDSTKKSNIDIYNLIYTPILIAQIQKTFLLLWLNEIVSVSNELRIHCNDIMQQYFEWAFMDLFELIENLHSLKGTHFERPTFVFSGQEDADFSLGISEQGYKYTISRIIDSENIIDRVLTNKKISYPPIGNYNLENKFIPFEKQHNSLLYFLNNLFRKIKFRDGQLPIINRILQCKDVIGILPTGSGKSLTYQLSTLLQPGSTLVVDPIKSLMKDQYDKLRENFIDKVIFINSSDEKETRQEKEDLISKGKYQVVIVGPERFQIQEFRNYLSSFHLNNLFFSYLVIDEAHCISEWGHDFRYAYLRLSDIVLKNCFHNNKEEFVQIALTATASFDVMADIQREIDVDNESILQPPDPDRKELHFEVVQFPSFQEIDKERDHIIKDGLYDYWKERTLASYKYPKLKHLLKTMIPQKIEELNDENAGITKENFWNSIDGNYLNSGIIYCPTKSDSKGNGAYAVCYNLLRQSDGSTVEKGLHTEIQYLAKGTYFGGGDDNSWENERIEEEAEKATENQTKFMQNKLNLIVATKAFGMGLDKPNVRFTIHYNLPTSIEAFYQEAGRAGRDGTHSLNYILYSPSDLESNLDNIKNAHKGTLREYITFNELLTEIKYEDEFGLKILNSKFQQIYPEYYVRRWINKENGNNRLYVNKSNITRNNNEIVNLNLELGNKVWINTNAGVVDESKSRQVGECLKQLLIELSNGMNYVEYLNIKQSDGIETKLQNGNAEYRIFIGFNNQIIQDLGKKIGDRTINNKKIPGSRVVSSAYNFCDGENKQEMENQFIKNLEYQYDRDELIPMFSTLGLNIEEFKKSFWKIRNSSDTQRAIYRLNILGVIDDYTVDYANDIFEIVFSGKEDGFYFNKLKDYLLKYIGETEAENTIELARTRNSEFDTTELRQCLNTLADFYAKAITQKRIHSAKYVKEAIDEFLENGESSFRKKVNNYFASKYASSFYSDFGYNTNFNIKLIEKYLSLIKDPEENNPGLEIDNLKHLIGSCDRYETDRSTEENGIVSLLKNISLMIIDVRNNKFEKVEHYWESICEILLDFKEQNKVTYEELSEVVNSIENHSNYIEPKTRSYTSKIKKLISLSKLNNKLLEFNKKYIA